MEKDGLGRLGHVVLPVVDAEEKTDVEGVPKRGCGVQRADKGIRSARSRRSGVRFGRRRGVARSGERGGHIERRAGDRVLLGRAQASRLCPSHPSTRPKIGRRTAGAARAPLPPLANSSRPLHPTRLIATIAVIAEHAKVRPDGKLDVTGVYNCRYVPELPAKLDVMLAMRYDVEPLDYG